MGLYLATETWLQFARNHFPSNQPPFLSDGEGKDVKIQAKWRRCQQVRDLEREVTGMVVYRM